jgi:hypothetical protein
MVVGFHGTLAEYRFTNKDEKHIMHACTVGSVVIPIIHCDLKFSSVCSLKVYTVILALYSSKFRTIDFGA